MRSKKRQHIFFAPSLKSRYIFISSLQWKNRTPVFSLYYAFFSIPSMTPSKIQSFEYYFSYLHGNIRIKKVFHFLISLPHTQRKFENCSSAMHSIRIAQNIAKTPPAKNQSEIIIALCHDILEDFPHISPHQLKKYCTADEIHEIQLLTKQPETTYHQYIQQILTSPLAKKIKKFDMLDNMQTAQKKQKEKYQQYLSLL